MGGDIFSACVFCAGLLLSNDLQEPSGPSAEIGFSYATLGRRYDGAAGLRDAADVTNRFFFLGFGMARPAAEGLGAGTPKWEWRLEFGLAPSDDDQTQAPAAPTRTQAHGRGRSENGALIYRHPLGNRDSIEIGLTERSHKATGVLNESAFSGQRTLTADWKEFSLGWRHRWQGFEVSLSGGYVEPSGVHATAGSFYISDGKLWGGSLEGRASRGAWTFLAGMQRNSGSIEFGEQSAPDFAARNSSSGSSLEAYRIGAGWSQRRVEAFLSATYDRSHLPFVSLAALGTEVAAFEQGFHADSRAHQFRADLTGRCVVNRTFHPRLFLRWTRGDETVTLTDSSGAAANRTLSVRRAGRPFGDITVGVGTEIRVGAEP